MNQKLATLNLYRGKEWLKAIPIKDGQVLRVGSSVGNADIPINYAYMDENHGFFQAKNGYVYYIDAGTGHGSYINDELVEPNEQQPLLNGATVGLLAEQKYFFKVLKRLV